MIPLRSNVPRVTIPYAVSAIIAVNVLVFLYVRNLDPHAVTRLYHLFGVVPARFMEPDWAVWMGYPKTLGWPLVTYMFLHGGWLHLILNMWMLWLFGDNIEDVTGHGWFVLFYLLCGLAAVGAHMVFEGRSPMPVVGASGAVAGVLGAYIVLYPHGRVLTLIPVFFFPFIFRIPASLFLGFWFLVQVFSGVYSTVQGAQDVAWWAHVGGFLAGMALIRWFRLPGACRYCYNPDSKDYDHEDSALPPL